MRLEGKIYEIEKIKKGLYKVMNKAGQEFEIEIPEEYEKRLEALHQMSLYLFDIAIKTFIENRKPEFMLEIIPMAKEYIEDLREVVKKWLQKKIKKAIIINNRELAADFFKEAVRKSDIQERSNIIFINLDEKVDLEKMPKNLFIAYTSKTYRELTELYGVKEIKAFLKGAIVIRLENRKIKVKEL